MQTGAHGVVLDLDLGTKIADEAIKSAPLGSSHVGGRDHPERHTTPFEVEQLRLDDPKSVPLDEGAQQVYLVSAVQL